MHVMTRHLSIHTFIITCWHYQDTASCLSCQDVPWAGMGSELPSHALPWNGLSCHAMLCPGPVWSAPIAHSKVLEPSVQQHSASTRQNCSLRQEAGQPEDDRKRGAGQVQGVRSPGEGENASNDGKLLGGQDLV
mmetsp:Transcript_21836/g.37296  ORF Transcript_21836/g.37296 Transcript_21836/m.37296 type:complete len:134 (-) Transcript_21836:324-725(-)